MYHNEIIKSLEVRLQAGPYSVRKRNNSYTNLSKGQFLATRADQVLPTFHNRLKIFSTKQRIKFGCSGMDILGVSTRRLRIFVAYESNMDRATNWVDDPTKIRYICVGSDSFGYSNKHKKMFPDFPRFLIRKSDFPGNFPIWKFYQEIANPPRKSNNFCDFTSWEPINHGFEFATFYTFFLEILVSACVWWSSILPP